MQKLIIQNNAIIGTTTADDPNNYQLIDPPTDWDNDLVGLVFEADTQTVNYSVDALRAKQTAMVQADATTQINAMQWRIERAQEREALGLPGESVNTVLLEREAIRRASNRLGASIAGAPDAASISAMVFAVTDADRATPERVTRLQFLNRFTQAEMAGVVAASEQSPALKTALLKWQTAEGIVLTDPATVAGVGALEMAGLLAAGRAVQITAVTP